MGQNIIARIQQMVAKAESTDSMAEAETIMTMVRRLLDAHGISLLEVGPAAESFDPVGTSHDIYGFWLADNWMRKLSAAAGDYYGVEVVWHSKGNFRSIAAVGRESCRAAYAAMLPYLRGQVRRLAQRGWANHDYTSESKGRTQIGIALSNRLYALAREKQRQAMEPGRAGAGMNALVPFDHIKAEMAASFPKLKTISLLSRARPNAAAVRAAASINISDQLKSEGAPTFVIQKR